MIGGEVVETIVLDSKVWINCKDPTGKQTCAIHVRKDERAECVEPGDVVWWQGNHAYWSPLGMAKGRWKPDTALHRIGFSGVRRPDSPVEKATQPRRRNG